MIKNFKIKITLFLLIILFAYLAPVSLLGENNRVKDLVYQYLECMENSNFKKGEFCFSDNFFKKNRFKNLTKEEYQFIFFLSAKEVLNIHDFKKDDVVVSINEFWIPFIDDNSLEIGMFAEKDDGEKRIDNLLGIVRERGKWKINSFNTKEPKLKKTFEKLVNKYEKFDNDFLRETILNQGGDIRNLNEIDKSLILFRFKSIMIDLKKQSGVI